MVDNKDNKKNFCYSCRAELEVDHIGIKCPQDDSLCSDCSKTLVDNIFEDYQANLPPKCPLCKLEIPALIFERQLSPALLATYQFYIASTKIAEDEIMKWCPECNYFEIWLKSSTATLLYCRNPSCEFVTCIFCDKNVKLPDYEEFCKRVSSNYEEGQEIIQEYEKMLEDGFFYHQTCADLYSLKKKIDNAIDEGEMRRCPQCGLAGRKDNNCTHMICSVCQTRWCYFCGKGEADCDKDPTRYGIYGHNPDWATNDKRCPMHFYEIHDLDTRWPENDEDCLNRFHRHLTLESLKKAVNSIGLDNYYKIADHFPSIKNNGYDIDEILAFDEELIDRANSNESSEEEEEEEEESEDSSDEELNDVLLHINSL